MCDVIYSILEIFETNKTIKVLCNKKDLVCCAADSNLYHTDEYAYTWDFDPHTSLDWDWKHGLKARRDEPSRTLESIYRIKYDYFEYEFEFC